MLVYLANGKTQSSLADSAGWRSSIAKMPFQTGGDTSNTAVGLALVLPRLITHITVAHGALEESWPDEYQFTLFPNERMIREWIAGKMKFPQSIFQEEFRDRYLLTGSVKLGKRLLTELALTDRTTNKKTSRSVELDLPALTGFQTSVMQFFQEAGISISDSEKVRMSWREDLTRPGLEALCRQVYWMYRFEYQSATPEQTLKAGYEALNSSPRSYLATIHYAEILQSLDYAKYVDSSKKLFEAAIALHPHGYSAAKGLYYIALDLHDDTQTREWGIKKAQIAGKDGLTGIAEQYAAQAQIAANKKDYLRAAGLYQQVIALIPTTYYRIRLARMYALCNNTAQADQTLRKALSDVANEADKQFLLQSIAEIWHERGNFYRDRFDRSQWDEDLDSALSSYRTAVVDLYKARYVADIASMYLRSPRLNDSAKEAAIQVLMSEAYRRLLAEQDRQKFMAEIAGTYNDYASVLAGKNALYLMRSAEYYFKKAVELEPSDFSYRYDLIQFYIKSTRNFEAAERWINSAMPRVQPDRGKSSVLWNCRGQIALQRGQYGTAIDHFLKSRASNPDNYSTLELLGLSYNAAKRYAEAIPVLEKCTAKDDDRADLFYTIGSAYLQIKNYDKAKSALLKSFALTPQNNAATYQLARVHAIKKEYADATKFFEIALQNNVAVIQNLDDDPAFTDLKTRPEYGQLKSKYGAK